LIEVAQVARISELVESLVGPEPGEEGEEAVELPASTPSAPRSRPLAATLNGGLRPGSLRVHAPCREFGHGSRLGFPGRRPPRGPAAPDNVARSLQVLPSPPSTLTVPWGIC
jgi:hypothetical protein